MLEIRTLGGLSLAKDGQAITDLGSRHAEALLVYLAVETGRHPRQLLATLFWPESPERLALTSLRGTLSILRKRLGAYLDIDREGACLKSDAAVYVDLSDLERNLAAGRAMEALALYHGDFLQGFHVRNSLEFEDWCRWEAERVRRQLINALHAAISRAIGSGDYRGGGTLVQQLLALDPLDELAHRQAMALLALDGRRTAALAQYEKCLQALNELAVEPSPETQELYRQILRGERPAPATLGIPQHNLPAAQTSFVGREQELARIADWLRDPAHRLLTLIGPGGIGKTRLALEAARAMMPSFPDGTFFVPLTSVSSSDYLIPAIADAIRFRVDTISCPHGPKDQLLDYLSNRSVLLVIDSFEHLMPGASLLSEILARAPNVQLLVTSRQRLDLQGEWTLPVAGLPLPAGVAGENSVDGGALGLFVQRARQRLPDFQPDDPDLAGAVHICRLVEGMPLAIELAAAWIPVLSPAEIAAEIKENPVQMTTSLRDVPERHRSLRAVFDGSWQLLPAEECRTFCQLAAFSGPFDRRAALEVVGAGLTQLSALLDRSLLTRDEAGYFHLHPLLRAYAAEKLDQQPAVRDAVLDRHSRYYIGYLLQRQADFMGPRMIQARDEIRREMENVRAAAHWAMLHSDAEAARQVLTGLLSCYSVQSWHEGIDLFRDLASARRESLTVGDSAAVLQDPAYLCARVHQAFLHINLGQVDETEAISRECLRPLADLGLTGERSECLHNLGVSASFRGEFESACELLEEAIRLGRESDHIVWRTYLLWLGHAYFMLGEYESGMFSLRKCYELFDRQGNRWGAAFALSKMGLAADGLGQYAGAIAYHRRALAIFEENDNQAGQGYALSRMSMSAYFMRDYHQAARLAQEGCDRFRTIGHRWGIGTSLCRWGFALIGLHELARARQCFTEALRQAHVTHTTPITLYALAGLACVMAQEGKEGGAGELYRLVRHHPQTPAIYFDTAAPWLVHLAEPSSRPGLAPPPGRDWSDLLAEAVDRLLAESPPD